MPRLIRPAPIPSRLVRAAGAVVWRFVDSARTAVPGEPIDPKDIEVLMVHRPRYKDWSWPKGKAERNEPLVCAAVREVEEETGLSVVLNAPLTTQRYRLGSGQTKEVHYWAGRLLPERGEVLSVAARTRRPVLLAGVEEIDAIRWASPSKADQMLTRRGDRRLLSEVVTRATNGQLVTSALVLVRHSKAVSRSAWDGGEATRPLTRVGVRQSLDLVDLLSTFGVENAVSSPWERCRRTLAPWSGSGGVEVRSEDALTEAACAADPAAAGAVVSALIGALASGEQGATAVCVHAPTIPHLLAPLREVAPSTLTRSFPQASPWLGTADMLIAHVGRMDGQTGMVALEHHGTRTKDVLGIS